MLSLLGEGQRMQFRSIKKREFITLLGGGWLARSRRARKRPQWRRHLPRFFEGLRNLG
jgi:hypothetical protein